jgi:hypothetical protein
MKLALNLFLLILISISLQKNSTIYFFKNSRKCEGKYDTAFKFKFGECTKFLDERSNYRIFCDIDNGDLQIMSFRDNLCLNYNNNTQVFRVKSFCDSFPWEPPYYSFSTKDCRTIKF